MNKKTAYGVLLAYKNLRNSTAIEKEDPVDLTVTGKLLSFCNIYRTILSKTPEAKPSTSDQVFDHSFTVEPVYTVIEEDGHAGDRYLEEPDLERFSIAAEAYLRSKFEGIVDIAQGVNGLRVFCQSADIKKIEAELGDFHSQHGGFMSETLDNYITDTLRTRHYALPVSLINGLIGEKDAQSVYRSHQAEAKHDLR